MDMLIADFPAWIRALLLATNPDEAIRRINSVILNIDRRRLVWTGSSLATANDLSRNTMKKHAEAISLCAFLGWPHDRCPVGGRWYFLGGNHPATDLQCDGCRARMQVKVTRSFRVNSARAGSRRRLNDALDDPRPLALTFVVLDRSGRILGLKLFEDVRVLIDADCLRDRELKARPGYWMFDFVRLGPWVDVVTRFAA